MKHKEALLIIDIQNDYFSGGAYPLVNPDKAAKNAKQLLLKFRAQKNLIIHVQHIAEQPDATFFLPETEGANIHSDVFPEPGERVVIKHKPNSFQETDLLYYLKGQRVTHLVICGMMTQICVDSTVRAAKEYGFEITLIADACATLDLEFQGVVTKAAQVQASFVSALQFFYANVITADQYLTNP